MIAGGEMAKGKRAMRFEGELFEGHKGVVAVLVPFDPEDAWQLKPHRLAGRRHGWPVTGSANGADFAGYIGDRWGRFFIAFEPEVLREAKAAAGDQISMVVRPTGSPEVVDFAREQSKRTTQPKVARADAIRVLVGK
jgi:hypothetical protein